MSEFFLRSNPVFIFLLIALGGCVAQVPPPDITGSVDSTGLVLVDVKIDLHDPNYSNAKATMTEAFLVNIRDESKLIEGKRVSGNVLFSGLSPGIYRLVSLRATWVRGELISREDYNLSSLSDQLTVAVSAGIPLYLGKVVISDSRTTNEGTLAFAMDRNPQHEVNTLNELAFRYEGTPWARKMKARMDLLTGR